MGEIFKASPHCFIDTGKVALLDPVEKPVRIAGIKERKKLSGLNYANKSNRTPYRIIIRRCPT